MAPLPSPSLLPLSQRLRRHIADSHAAIERTTIARAMVAGTVTRSQYAGLLVQLAVVHRVLERRHGEIAGLGLFPAASVARSEAADRDAAACGARPAPAWPATAALDAWIASAASAAIIGACYVVAGSLLGSRVLRPLLARAFALDDARVPGLDYHNGADQIAAAWPGVLSAIDRLDQRWDRELVLDGALRMFDGLGEIYAGAMHP